MWEEGEGVLIQSVSYLFSWLCCSIFFFFKKVVLEETERWVTSVSMLICLRACVSVTVREVGSRWNQITSCI